MAGVAPRGPIVVFDDDHYYMGGVLAERLCQLGLAVTLVTPAESASHWTHNTLEHGRIQTRLLELGVEIVANRTVTAFNGDHVATACVYTGRARDIPCSSLVTVTARLPNDGLFRELESDAQLLAGAGIRSLTAIGDALAPATIAHAVYAGHRYARELDADFSADQPFAREMTMGA
jgi:dimethylamine/trimethylamine dehydrogenase